MTNYDAFLSSIRHKFKMICANESGATAIEYALIASGISIAIFATLVALGGRLVAVYQLLTVAV